MFCVLPNTLVVNNEHIKCFNAHLNGTVNTLIRSKWKWTQTDSIHLSTTLPQREREKAVRPRQTETVNNTTRKTLSHRWRKHKCSEWNGPSIDWNEVSLKVASPPEDLQLCHTRLTSTHVTNNQCPSANWELNTKPTNPNRLNNWGPPVLIRIKTHREGRLQYTCKTAYTCKKSRHETWKKC